MLVPKRLKCLACGTVSKSGNARPVGIAATAAGGRSPTSTADHLSQWARMNAQALSVQANVRESDLQLRRARTDVETEERKARAGREMADAADKSGDAKRAQ